MPDINEYVKYIKKIWQNRWLTNHGKFVNLLEEKLAGYLSVNNLVCVANGTLALQLALMSYDFERDAEIITTPFSFIATTNVIINEKLKPVFADIDPETYNIDPKEVEKKITRRTKAILATHVFGNPCELKKLKQIADKHGLKLIYDAAHAFGVEYKSRPILSFGDISILSFHATKVYHTIEGGAVIAKNSGLFKKIKLLRDFGIESEEKFVLSGVNAKMNEFQAAMGLCNLEEINQWIKKRKNIYNRYSDGLTGEKIKFQKLISSRHNYGYMPVCFDSKQTRDRICHKLIQAGVKPRKYFYPLITDCNHVKYFAKKSEFKNAASVADTILCLPIYPDLEIKIVNKIISIIKANI